MKEMGGYFEIEFPGVYSGIHEEAIKLNTARNCFEYILLANKYSKVYLPYFTCDAVLEPVKKLGIGYEFYHINEQLEALNIPALKTDEAFLCTNYFGIKGEYINRLSSEVNNLIVDNAQALFEMPIEQTDTFYSLRKFVGTPDGGFLYCSKILNEDFPVANSYNRVSHLYKRKDVSASFGYDDFKRNEKSLDGLPISFMSPSTESFVEAYDFEKNKGIRKNNFAYMHSKLQQLNQLSIDVNDSAAPLCYPLLTSIEHLKEKLIASKVYIPTYWPNVLRWLEDKPCREKKLIHSMVCLPIDQRYTIEDLNSVIQLILD
jgi:hypothetical protein